VIFFLTPVYPEEEQERKNTMLIRRRENTPPIDQDTQCWLLAACCALYPEEFASYPELRALRRAILDRQPECIAVALEVVCSHLAGELSERQMRLALRLAQDVRRGAFQHIRSSVLALSRASLAQRRRAC
jgi:hypothetical protein